MFAHVRAPSLVPRRAGDRGETLIEVLVTIVLMGVGFVAILSGIFSAVKTANANQERTRASITVQAWAEMLLQPALPIPATTAAGEVPQVNYTTYIACATTGAYGNNPPSGALPSGYTASVTQIRYMTGMTASGPTWSSNINDCYALTEYSQQGATRDAQGNPRYWNRDKGLQEITIKIDSGVRGGGQFADTLVFIKRDKRCPGTFDNADLGPC